MPLRKVHQDSSHVAPAFVQLICMAHIVYPALAGNSAQARRATHLFSSALAVGASQPPGMGMAPLTRTAHSTSVIDSTDALVAAISAAAQTCSCRYFCPSIG